MRKRTRTPRLSVEALEARAVPFAGPFHIPVDTGELLELTPVASLTYDNGVVTAVGTTDTDVIRIDPHQSDPGPILLFAPLEPVADSIRVTITDAAGQVRTDVNGNPLDLSFAVSAVVRVDVVALGGDDTVVNATGVTMDADGGDGNDTVQGGTGLDILRGAAGNDSLLGGAGNDVMSGGPGDNDLRGEAGDDFLNGGAGGDLLDGGAGVDRLFGLAGRDVLSGGDGDDFLYGGDGFSAPGDDADTLFGDAGNDLLRGEGGDDRLFGGVGNDRLYDEAGNDSLFGDAGNDALFGGTGKDVLRGGAGTDRFLKWVRAGNQTTVKDRASGESVTTFQGTTKVQVDEEDGPDLRYNPAQWTLAEIEAVDAGLGFLHAETGNTRLLRLWYGKDMTFVRWGSYIPYNTTDGKNDAKEAKANQKGASTIAANHRNGTVDVRRLNANDVMGTATTVVHELAHNWDTENPRYKDWLKLSGWRRGFPGPTALEERSTDGQWVFRKTAQFFRDYGKTNPREDFATMFEAHYNLRSGTLSTSDQVRLAAKLEFIQKFVASMK